MKRTHEVLIDAEACIGCGLCKRDCPMNNLVVEERVAHVVSQQCIMCGHCVAICPKGAVSMTGFDEEPMELHGPVRVDADTLALALKARRSVRQFAARPVDAGVIDRIVEAGRVTPTGGNAQDVEFVVLRDALPEVERVAVRLFRRLFPFVKRFNASVARVEIDEHFFFKGAPVALAVVAKDTVDASLAAANMALMAETCGLGVLYSGFFATATRFSPSLRRMLGLHRGQHVVATLVLGHPAVRYHRTAPKEPASVRML
ncbi:MULTISPECIES: nitroreductase family protein [Gordonibacter]|uniref:Nitroreductase family protein n=1 Tax=Gordonibacter faecis TaxID=3047475 RepID=A0ABT7DIW1_9ACTN|nr:MULTISPECIES: nitroreductase family protein [unclassified Gordonibacter]MDJ1649465.1 nitroreductase family protein [Gordonibacter sp. KGMB12511]